MSSRLTIKNFGSHSVVEIFRFYLSLDRLELTERYRAPTKDEDFFVVGSVNKSLLREPGLEPLDDTAAIVSSV